MWPETLRLPPLVAVCLLATGCQLMETSAEHRDAADQAALTASMARYAERVAAMDPPSLESEYRTLAEAPDDPEIALRLAILLVHPGPGLCDVDEARRRLQVIADRPSTSEAIRALATLLAYFAERSTCQDPDRLAELLVEEQRQRLAAQDEALEASKEVVRIRVEMRALKEQLAALKSLEEQIRQREAVPQENPP